MQSSDKGFMAVVVNGTWPHPDVLETAERQVLERREAAELQACSLGACAHQQGNWLLGETV